MPTQQSPTTPRLGDLYLAAVVERPQRGQVVAQVRMRMPYAAHASDCLVDVSHLPRPDAFALLAACMPANTAKTSALPGLLSKLEAMALQVRSRSYVLIASCTSSSGAARLCKASRRRSKSSVKSFTVMDGLSVMEVATDRHPKAARRTHQARVEVAA